MQDEYRYYEALGLHRDASSSEITRAYRSLAKTYHPDVSLHPKAAENFHKIREAYEILSDPKKRREYDAYLDAVRGHAYGKTTYEPHIEDEFYVQNETITIDGEDYVFTNAHHVVINGQEYIEYNGEYLHFSRDDEPAATSTRRKIADVLFILICLVAVYLLIYDSSRPFTMQIVKIFAVIFAYLEFLRPRL